MTDKLYFGIGQPEVKCFRILLVILITFQTRIMPFTDDRQIVTSSADGQVRLGQVPEDGRVDTKRLGKHQGHVYKIAVEPGSPYIFYSCGKDDFVQHVGRFCYINLVMPLFILY